jgi:uncharacterized lipoprotein YmbA
MVHKLIQQTRPVSALGALLTLVCALTSCATKNPEVVYVEPQAEHFRSPHDPGVVNFVYERPMVNIVEVPAGLDPEGVYYMPPHRSVVEIRQGRWTYVEE